MGFTIYNFDDLSIFNGSQFLFFFVFLTHRFIGTSVVGEFHRTVMILVVGFNVSNVGCCPSLTSFYSLIYVLQEMVYFLIDNLCSEYL